MKEEGTSTELNNVLDQTLSPLKGEELNLIHLQTRNRQNEVYSATLVQTTPSKLIKVSNRRHNIASSQNVIDLRISKKKCSIGSVDNPPVSEIKNVDILSQCKTKFL